MTTAEPFAFLGCLELRELLQWEAHDARELGTALEKVPAESLFCHMAAVLMHRSAMPETYPNDFALWAASEARDARLAERLAAVDAFQADSMERVRGADLDHQRSPAALARSAPRRPGPAVPLLPGPPGACPDRTRGAHVAGVSRCARRGGRERALLSHHRRTLPAGTWARRLCGVDRDVARAARRRRSARPH